MLFLQTKGLLLIAATTAVHAARRPSAASAACAPPPRSRGGGRRRRRAAAAGLEAVGAGARVVHRAADGQLPRSHRPRRASLAVACVLIAVAMAVIALRLRDRLLVAVAVVQARAGRQHAAQHRAAPRRGQLVPADGVRAAGAAATRRPAAAGAPRRAAAPAKLPPATVMMAIVVATFVALLATPAGRPILQAEHALLRLHPARPAQPLPPAARRRRARDLRGPFMPGLYFALGKKNPYFVSETVVCDADCRRRCSRSRRARTRPIKAASIRRFLRLRAWSATTWATYAERTAARTAHTSARIR